MQTDPKIQQLVNNMVSAGVPLQQAIAVAISIEHSINSKDFAVLYGTFTIDALKDFVNTTSTV